jgi:pimeloyl-ACP methyl ester carboxylesterase
MSLYVYESGPKEAPAIVFIHGGGFGGWMWQKQLEYFKVYHCIVPDLPEHGKSAGEKPLSLTKSAESVAGIIKERASGGRAHIVGHSLGAKVVIELLNLSPEAVDHAVAASALYNPSKLFNIAYSRSSNRLTASLTRYRWLMNAQAKQFKFPDEYYTGNFIKDSQALTAEVLDDIASEMYNHVKLPEGLSKAEVPSLIIAGGNELKAMKKSVGDMAKVLPDSKGIIINGALHNYPWAMCNLFNGIVDAWINDRPLPEKGIDYVK